MVLDKKIGSIRDRFGIVRMDDWREITPQQILSVPDVGQQTLNHLRLHLAGHGLTLKNDETPVYWQTHLYQAKIGTTQVSAEDVAIVSPFTVLIDEQEKLPFTFQGLLGYSADQSRPIIVRTKRKSLGPSHGDYSLEGLEGECHIERKSMQDAIGTLLGWNDRRRRFENTLEFLASCWTSAVVVECTFGQLLLNVDSHGKKSKQENQRSLLGTVLAYQNDYSVAWHFCDTRKLAETVTFRLMQRCWRKKIEFEKEAHSEKVS